VHGLGGTAAVVLLLLAAVPDPLWAAAMLVVFALMSIASMAACTGLYAWLLTRPALASVYRSALVPALGCFGLMFGSWYVRGCRGSRRHRCARRRASGRHSSR
jgi:hypothetical protein